MDLVKDRTCDRAKQYIMNNKDQIDINFYYENGFTALLWPLYRKNIHMVRLLIDNFKDQININLQDKNRGFTALYWAINGNNVDMLNLLIDNFKDQIDINIRDKIHRSVALFWLINKPGNPRNYKRVKMIKLLIDNFKSKIDINIQDKYGHSIVHYVCWNESFNWMLKLLIHNFKDQIDINLQDKEFKQAVLHWMCSEKCNIKIAKLLIDNFKNQIDINLEDRDRDTPIHIAVKKNNIDMVNLLVDKFKDKIDINLRDGRYLNTILHYSCSWDKTDLTKLFIDNFKNKIDINELNRADQTVLNIACNRNNIDMIKLIIDNFKDIDVMVLDRFHHSAWYLYLKNHGQDENFKDLFLPLLLNRDKSKDPHGLTPLHIAYLLRNQNDGEEILEYLLNELPELVELDGLQRDKFQTLPHQVTPLPRFDNQSFLYRRLNLYNRCS